MITPRTKSIIAGVFLFFMGWIVGLLFSYERIDQTLNERIKTEIQRNIINNGLVRGQLQSEISQLQNKIDSISEERSNDSTEVSTHPLQVLGILKKLQELEEKVSELDAKSSLLEVIKPAATKAQVDAELNQKISSANRFLDEHRQKLEDAYFEEVQDTHWAPAINDKISQLVAQYQEQTQSSLSIVNTDCKTTLCRLELVHNPDEDTGLFELSLLDSLGDEIGESSSQIVQDEIGESNTTVYYLARKGYSVVRN